MGKCRCGGPRWYEFDRKVIANPGREEHPSTAALDADSIDEAGSEYGRREMSKQADPAWFQIQSRLY